MLKRILIGTAGSSVGAAYLYNKESDVGVVRFGRAAIVAGQVIWDYKKAFSSAPTNEDEYRVHLSKCHQTAADRLLNMCCKNGGCFIKVGQHVGSLDYLLPQEYVNTMKILHDQAPESPLKDIYAVLEEDLGIKIDEVFSSFDTKPIGTASLAQVHRATLKSGEEVAVKVQHKRVKANSFVDISTMEALVKFAAWLFPSFKFLWLAEEVKTNLPIELDFECEGKNAETVAKLFKHLSFLKVPHIYWDLSSQRVLTMEFCHGGNADNREYMIEHEIPVESVSDRLSQLYSEMIFEKGFVHCDPHPGNVLVKKTDNDIQIILLDHGLYTTLADQFRLNYAKLWVSILRADLDGIKKYSDAMNCGELYGLFSCMVAGRAWSSIEGNKLDIHSSNNKEDAEIQANASQLIPEMVEVLNKVPREMLLVFKTNDCLRGIDSRLKTRFRANSFVNMSKVCTRVVYDEQLSNRISFPRRVKLHIEKIFSLFMIDLGAFLLRHFAPLINFITARS